MSGEPDTPDDRLRERADASQAKLWLLLEADRRLVTTALIAVVFLTLVAAGALLPGAVGSLLDGDSVDTLFQALLGATITGVTLVLTLNQVVLSQELGAAGDQRERMEGATAFRDDVADAVGAPVGPARPAEFLRALVATSGERARALRGAVPEGGDPELLSAVEKLAEGTVENVDRVSEGLDGARFGEYDVVSSALNFNYSWKLFEARRIQDRFGDELNGEATAALDGLIEVLRLFGPAREHFKTLYFQWELINLSRHILVASIPALIVSAVMVAFFDHAAYVGPGLDAGWLVVIISGAITVAVMPFLVLLAYVARIATVTKHTLSIGPFVIRGSDDVEEVEWEE